MVFKRTRQATHTLLRVEMKYVDDLSLLGVLGCLYGCGTNSAVQSKTVLRELFRDKLFPTH